MSRNQSDSQTADAHSPAEAVVHATQDAVLAIDSEANVTFCNAAAARMFGYEQDELMGRSINSLMGQPYAREHDGYIRRYESTGEKKAIGRVRAVSGRRRDGEEFPIELSVTEYEEAGQRRYAAILRDVSEKARLTQARVEAEKMAAIGTTASKFAHELGNPINGMAVSVQLLKRWLDRADPPPEPRVTERLELLMGGIDRLTELLGEFRMMSRRHEYRFEAIDLRAMVAELCEMERPAYSQKEVAIETDVAHDLGPVRADPGKLRQVLLNLCKNALEALPDGGTITVSADRTAVGVMLEVRDTGPGIPAETDVFAPFTSTKPDGSGLGLPIAKQIIEAHHGSLSYDCPPSGGTVFRIQLPG
ncbi:MAG: two-component system sensor histidine kinase NtrB [Nannocystaceae bacterium]|nr:PAS domain S-box protein [bacterium]